MASVSMTNEQRLQFIKSQAPQDLIVAMESLADTLSSVVDIRRELRKSSIRPSPSLPSIMQWKASTRWWISSSTKMVRPFGWNL